MRKRTILWSIIGIAVLAAVLHGYYFYVPPLLRTDGCPGLGFLYDRIAYAYHFTRMTWLKGKEGARRAAALSVWYRPERSTAFLGVPPHDLESLAEEFVSVGLRGDAVALLDRALDLCPDDPERSARIISSLGSLGAWPQVGRGIKRYVTKFPLSAELYYWGGRAFLEAGRREGDPETFFAKSREAQPDLVDALYQSGRALEQRGNTERARECYRQVVASLPGHREAWKALLRLGGNDRGNQEAREKIQELTPEISREVEFGDAFRLLGYRFEPPRSGTAGKMLIELWLEGRRPAPVQVRPEARIASSKHPMKLKPRPAAPLPETILAAGEVRKLQYRFDLPLVFYPGEVSCEISFTSRQPPRIFPGRPYGADHILLGTFPLVPTWVADSAPGETVRTGFGPGAEALDKSTFLGPGDELTMEIGGRTSGGVGLVSFGHTSSSLPQGTEIARVWVRTREEGDLVFPVVVGKETAEVWWEYFAPERRKHERARVFRSRAASQGGKDFNSNEYQAWFPFQRLLTVEAITLKNLQSSSGFCVKNLILLPGEIKSTTEDTVGAEKR